MPKPKTTDRLWPYKKPDLDNLTKAVLDACNGIVWKDDGCIVWLELKKLYAVQEPKVLVKVMVIGEFENNT